MKVVISQPMLFPWVGMLEQVALADVYVHYSDVQFSKGGFTNRVQVKLPGAIQWMTVPLDGLHLGQKIHEVRIDDRQDWRTAHLQLLGRSFDGLPFAGDALRLASDVYRTASTSIGNLAEASLLSLARYFGIEPSGGFRSSREIAQGASSSRRVLDIVHALHGDTYVTGHGARAYLDHGLFEAEGVEVQYVDYRKRPYPQAHGAFTPYVTGLDLVANMGHAGREYICSGLIHWREFTAHE